MTQNEGRLNELEIINEKITELDDKLSTLQNLILNMRNEFNIYYESNLRLKRISKFEEKTTKNYKDFESEIPTDCKVKTRCALIVENEVLKTLRIYEMSGPQQTLNYIQETKEKLIRLAKKSNCKHENCVNNSLNIFNGMNDIIVKLHKKHLNQEINGEILENELFLDNEIEEDISNLLAPLSNNLRIKILKILSKGRKSFTQMEEGVGIQGGHLQHHLKHLIKTDYIEKNKGYYQLTTFGLIILKYLSKMRKNMYNLHYV